MLWSVLWSVLYAVCTWLKRQKNSEGQKNSLKSGVINVQEVCKTNEVHKKKPQWKQSQLSLKPVHWKKIQFKENTWMKPHFSSVTSMLLHKPAPKRIHFIYDSFQLHKHAVTIPELKTDKADYRHDYFWVLGLFIKLMPQSFPHSIFRVSNMTSRARSCIAGIWKADPTQALSLANSLETKVTHVIFYLFLFLFWQPYLFYFFHASGWKKKTKAFLHQREEKTRVVWIT